MKAHLHHHGVVDPSLFSTEQGIHAVQLSFWILFATAVVQSIVVVLSGSVALLSDTIHNFADAAAGQVEGIQEVTEVRVRWIGHRLHAELNVAADSRLSLEEAHELAKSVSHELLHYLTYLSNATIHVDPVSASGEEYHWIESHAHDGLPDHSH